MILPFSRLIIRANTVYFLHIVTCFVFLNLFEVIYLWNKKAYSCHLINIHLVKYFDIIFIF